MIEICYEEIDEVPSVNSDFLFFWFLNVCEVEDKKLGAVTLVFCSDEYLLTMNRKHLNHDYYTDIITFDYTDNILISGDLFISIERVKENAASFGSSFQDELDRVCVHGLLHLCGYTDKTQDQEFLMREKEDQMLGLRMFHVKHLKGIV